MKSTRPNALYRKPTQRLARGGLLLAMHLVGRCLGLAEHTSVIGGMPLTRWSVALGPLHLVLYLGAVVLAPILVLAAAGEGLVIFVRRSR